MRNNTTGIQEFEHETRNIPKPRSPDPTLLEIAVKLINSERLANAPMRVSGVPPSPNPVR
jgi:hypothetical protein